MRARTRMPGCPVLPIRNSDGRSADRTINKSTKRTMTIQPMNLAEILRLRGAFLRLMNVGSTRKSRKESQPMVNLLTQRLPKLLLSGRMLA